MADMEGIASLTEGYADKLEPIAPDLEADPEEEVALGIGLHKLMSDLYGDETLPKFANVFHKDERPLMEVIPDLLEPMLLSAKSTIEEQTDQPAPSSVFFAEEGLMQQGVTMLMDLAQQLGIPGSDDPDQYSAALMGIHKKAGEHILEQGDEEAVGEALEMGGQLVARGYGQPGLDEAQAHLQKGMKKRPLDGAVERGLLGV